MAHKMAKKGSKGVHRTLEQVIKFLSFFSLRARNYTLQGRKSQSVDESDLLTESDKVFSLEVQVYEYRAAETAITVTFRIRG